MLDLKDNTIKPLSVQTFFGDLSTLPVASTFSNETERLQRLTKVLQEAKDVVQPERSLQGPVFQQGEIIEIKGAKFELIGIGKRTLRLKVVKTTK